MGQASPPLISHLKCIRLHFAGVPRQGPNRDPEGALAIVVVSYQYSTSSDRVLDKDGTWTGEVQGLSLATVMSELRRSHRGATNISITDIEWRHAGFGRARTHERRADPGSARARPWHLMTL